MKINLLRHTEQPEKTCALAARLCYSHLGIDDLSDTITSEKIAQLLHDVIVSGHHSVLEHASFTFGIEGISRALLAQLTRHRLASFSVQSQRYVTFKDDLEYIIPETIANIPEHEQLFNTTVKHLKEIYNYFIEAGIPAEDARYILPQASSTKIIMTMNARELRHFFSLRCCGRAQTEIRYMACQMLSILKVRFPLIFNDAGPACVSGKCTESHPCGKPWKNDL